MAKRRRSFSLDPDVADALEQRPNVNASSVANEFFKEFLFGGEMNHQKAALLQEKKQLERDIDELEEQLERKRGRLSTVEEEIEEVEEKGIPADVEERFEKIDSIARGNPQMLDPDNPAVQTQAGKVGMDSGRFLEQFRDWYDGPMEVGPQLSSVATDGGDDGDDDE